MSMSFEEFTSTMSDNNLPPPQPNLSNMAPPMGTATSNNFMNMSGNAPMYHFNNNSISPAMVNGGNQFCDNVEFGTYEQAIQSRPQSNDSREWEQWLHRVFVPTHKKIWTSKIESVAGRKRGRVDEPAGSCLEQQSNKRQRTEGNSQPHNLLSSNYPRGLGNVWGHFRPSPRNAWRSSSKTYSQYGRPQLRNQNFPQLTYLFADSSPENSHSSSFGPMPQGIYASNPQQAYGRGLSANATGPNVYQVGFPCEPQPVATMARCPTVQEEGYQTHNPTHSVNGHNNTAPTTPVIGWTPNTPAAPQTMESAPPAARKSRGRPRKHPIRPTADKDENRVKQQRNSTETRQKLKDYKLIRRELGLGEFFKAGTRTTVAKLADEWGNTDAASVRAAAKQALQRYYDDGDAGIKWPTEWIKQQYCVLRKTMTPKSHMEGTDKRSRIPKLHEDIKMAMSACLTAWRLEHGDLNKEEICKLIRGREALEPLIPEKPASQRKLTKEIQLLLDHHPWYEDHPLPAIDFSSPNATSGHTEENVENEGRDDSGIEGYNEDENVPFNEMIDGSAWNPENVCGEFMGNGLDGDNFGFVPPGVVVDPCLQTPLAGHDMIGGDPNLFGLQ